MIEIIWTHIRACFEDLRARRLGDLYAERSRGDQVIVHNEHREWRLK